MKVAIVGGGIAGLSAAWELEKLRRAGAPVEYRLFEAAAHLGGVIGTERLGDDTLLEAGPDSFLSEKPQAAELCRELNLGNELIFSNDVARKTWILLHGRLQPLPEGMKFFVPTRIAPLAAASLFSFRAKLRFAREYVLPPPPAKTEDESVAEFVARHFGREVVERVAEPLLAGIFGAGADALSVKAVLPRFTQMEAEHRSLVRAMLAQRRATAGKDQNRPLFTTLRGGMQQLVDALVENLNSSWLQSASPVKRIRNQGGRWLVSSLKLPQPATDEAADAIILALPAWAAADLLSDSPELAQLLSQLQYTSSAAVNFVFDRKALGADPPGFGFLVPRSERRKLLACTFAHNKFADRASPARAIFRCFFAGPTADELLAQNDDAIASAALDDLRAILPLGPSAPETVRVSRWPRAMPVYAPGHIARKERICALAAQLPAFALAGNFLAGVGVPDCIRSGAEAAGLVAGALGKAALPSGSLQPGAASGV